MQQLMCRTGLKNKQIKCSTKEEGRQEIKVEKEKKKDEVVLTITMMDIKINVKNCFEFLLESEYCYNNVITVTET